MLCSFSIGYTGVMENINTMSLPDRTELSKSDIHLASDLLEHAIEISAHTDSAHLSLLVRGRSALDNYGHGRVSTPTYNYQQVEVIHRALSAAENYTFKSGQWAKHKEATSDIRKCIEDQWRDWHVRD